MTSTRSTRLQRGAGMVETMVGILIGLLVVLVVYNMLAVAEGYKRTTASAADAQVTGLIAHFVSGLAAGNGGNGYTSAFNDLINCHYKEDGSAYSVDLLNKSTNSIKPISVMIFPGASNDDSDAFIAWEGASPHVLWPVPVRDPSPAPGAAIVVQSPNGFATPAKVALPTGTDPWWAVMMTNISEVTNPDFGKCALIQVTDASPADDATGQVSLTQGSAPYATTIAYAGVPINDTGTPAYLLNLGRVNNGAQRVRYDVAGNQMRTTNCLLDTGCVGQIPNPIAQNIVLMKVQYGIDTDPAPGPGVPYDGAVNCWSPGNGTCSIGANQDWDPVTINNAGLPGSGTPAGHLNRIVAVRIGIVVRSDEPDPRNPALFIPTSSTIDLKLGTRQPEWLFNCPANDATCQGRVPLSAGPAAPNVLLDGWRYRVYETVIPLRNSIFNATLPQP